LTIINKKLFYRREKLLFNLFIIVLALIVSFLYGFKHLLWLSERDWNYQNTIFFTSFEAWDVDHYIAQIKEVSEGNYLLSNAYLAEHKNTERSPWPIFPLYLAASVGKFFYIKVQHLAVLMDFTLPALIFLLAYWFLYTISPARKASILGAFLLALFPHLSRIDVLLYMGFDFLQEGFSPPILADAHCYYCFSGTINPQLTYTFLLASLLFFSKGIVTSKNRFFLLASLFGITTSYSYVFFSSYLYVFLAINTSVFFLLKERIYFRKSIFLLGGILICAFPFWYAVFSFSHEGLEQMAYMDKDRTPLIYSSFINAHLRHQLLLTLLICAGIIYYLRKGPLNKMVGITSFSLLLSGIICLEQHVITGINVQPWHYDAYVNPQSTILAVTLLMAEFLQKRTIRKFPIIPFILYAGICLTGLSIFLSPSFVASYLSSDGILTPAFESFLRIFHLYGFCIGLGLVILGLLLKTRLYNLFSKFGLVASGLLQKTQRLLPINIRIGNVLYVPIIMYVIWDIGLGQYEYYHQELKPKFGYLQEIAPALEWLNEHTEKESVILGSPDHTSTNSIIPIYTNNNIYVSFHSQFYTIPPLAEIHDRFYNTMYVMGITSQAEFEQYLDGHWFKEGSFDVYREKLTKDVYSELTKYRVDYLFYGPRERKNFKVDPGKAYTFLTKVYDDGIVEIYRIL